MADPKYDNLYGIARDQPDVYETGDLPEVDQPEELYEETSFAVERLHISASEAFAKFQHNEVDVTNVDFSDRIGRRNYNKGYSVNSWELAENGQKETLIQKYNRLKLELVSLIEEDDDLKKDVPEDVTAYYVEASRELYEKLKGLKLDEKIGINSGKSIENTEGIEFSKAISHLDNLSKEIGKDASTNEDTSVPKLESETSISNVQLSLQLNTNKQMQLNSLLANMSQKLSKLESVIGVNNKQQQIRFCNVNLVDGLVNCCQWMVAKLSLLDAAQLDAIESRLTAVNAKLDRCLASENSLSRDTERENKINQLYELSKKAQSSSDLISNLIERMVAMESLHKQSKNAVQIITHLEELQTSLTENLLQNKNLLNNTKENFQSNLTAVKNNIESLNSRLDVLVAKKNIKS